jgi:hypothetical protein
MANKYDCYFYHYRIIIKLNNAVGNLTLSAVEKVKKKI